MVDQNKCLSQTIRVSRLTRIIVSLFFICAFLFMARGFIADRADMRACSYLSGHEFDEAIRIFEKFLMVNPNNIFALNWMGFAYQQKGDLEKAINVYERAVLEKKADRLTYFSLAVIFLQQGDHAKAKKYFHVIMDMGPESPGELDLLGTSYYDLAKNYSSKQ